MKIRKLIMLFALALSLCIALPSASANENVLITVAANPTELAEAGLVEMNFSISNYTDYELHGVTISSNGAAFDLNQDELIIPANGSAYNIIIKVPVSDSQIGLPINFVVSWTQGGEPMTQTVSTTINRAADPIISLERKASAELAKEGDTINVEYVLSNKTKFDMTNITLIDEQMSDTPIFTNDSLRAGNSITIQYSYKMGTEDALSAPVITYSVLGKTKTFSAIQPLTIKLINVKLSLGVEMGTPTSDGVLFTLEVKNSGNQDIKNITILDDKQNFVNQEPFSLAAGETESISYKVVPSMTEPVRIVQFTITGTDAQGSPYKLEPTTTNEVYPYVDDSQIATSILAEITEPWSSSMGSIKMKISIQNASTVTLSNVQVSEQTLGIIKVIDKLEQGETSFEQVLTIGSPRNLTFSIKGIDPAGAMRELGSVSVQVAYSDATLAPEATPVPESIGTGAFSALTGTLSKVLIGLGVLMCIAFVTLVLLSLAEKRQMNLVEKHEEEEEMNEAFWAYDDRRTKKNRSKKAPQRSARPMRTQYREDDREDYTDGVDDRPPVRGRVDTDAKQLVSPEGYEDSEDYADPIPHRSTASYRPARRIPPIEAPIEVEYDDEAEPMPGPAIELPAKVTREDLPSDKPKVLGTYPPTNATAPRRDAIRHVKKG